VKKTLPPHHSCHYLRGFTLIELMITVAIVAILTTLAYPSYLTHIKKTRRAEAKTALLDLATRQERYFSVNNIYADTPIKLGFPGAAFPIPILVSTRSYYNMSVTVGTPPSTYTVTATAQGDQATDACGNFTLNYLGQQSNSTAEVGCW
jgi:type IV pilus assembly protein PilE